MIKRASSLPSSLPGRVLDRATRPPVLTVFAVVQALLLAIVVTGHMATRGDPAPADEDPGTGDFAAFFTGGTMVRTGQGAELYDFQVQRIVQADYLGQNRGYWQPYLNPPGLAMALAPATALGYVAAFRIFSGVLFLCLLGSLLFLLKASPAIAGRRVSAATALLLTIGFLPVALTTFGGQNTALTLALLAGTYAATRLERPVVAGVLLGLLTYKPQFVVVVGIVFLLQRQYTTVTVAALVGLLHYGLGAMVSGPGWPLDYLAALSAHGPVEMAQNGVWHFSLPAAANRWMPGAFGGVVGWAGALAVLILLVGAGRKTASGSPAYPAFFGMVVAGTMLAAPHLQYYELGLLALPLWLGLETLLGRGTHISIGLKLCLVAVYFGYPLWKLSGTLPIQPFFLVLLAVFIWSRQVAKVPQERGLPTQPGGP